jgi:hypothetical protein
VGGFGGRSPSIGFGGSMSANNGDKSRYQVNRKRAVLRRSKIRELMNAVKAGTAAKPGAKAPEPAAK